jgi:hypothetical protein
MKMHFPTIKGLDEEFESFLNTLKQTKLKVNVKDMPGKVVLEIKTSCPEDEELLLDLYQIYFFNRGHA